MPLYGSQLLDLDSRAITGLFTAWRKAIRHIFSLPYRTHSRYLHLICNDLPIDFQLYKRFVKFFRSLCRSNNDVIIKCCSLIKSGSGSAVSNSLTKVSNFFKVSRYDLGTVNLEIPDLNCNDEDLSISIAIRDLLTMRYEASCHYDTFFNSDEIMYILNFLCV